jgi:hypothetical protein
MKFLNKISKAQKILAASLTVIAFIGGGYRIYRAWDAKRMLERTYPKIERLMAIYSFLHWRSPQQQPPELVGADSFGGSDHLFLKCENVQWDKGGFVKPGELLECFIKPVPKWFDGEEEPVEVSQVSSSEDFWYTFKWETLFGYELDVLVGVDPIQHGQLYVLRDSVDRQQRAMCEEEYGTNGSELDHCQFITYAIELADREKGFSATFLASNGHLVYLANGALSRSAGWVIYLDDVEPITVGNLNKFIQTFARSLGMSETDLVKVVPELETIWLGMDHAFTERLFDELESLPDLEKLTGFVEGE